MPTNCNIYFFSLQVLLFWQHVILMTKRTWHLQEEWNYRKQYIGNVALSNRTRDVTFLQHTF